MERAHFSNVYVASLAALARIALGDAQQRHLATQLNAIVEYVDRLQKVQGTASHGSTAAVLRDDVAGSGWWDQALLLENVPTHSGNKVLVPEVFGDELN